MAHEISSGGGGKKITTDDTATKPDTTNPTNPTNKVNTTSTQAGLNSAQIADRLSSLYNAYASQRQSALEGAYARARDSVNSGFDSAVGALQGNLNASKDAINSSYDNSLKGLNTDAEKSLREAYLNKVLSQRDMRQKLSAMGMNGGATESSMAKLLNNYGNARNNIRTTLNTNIGDLSAKRDQSLADAYQNYNSSYASLEAQRASQLANLEQALANGMANALDSQYSFQIDNLGTNMNNILSALQNFKGTLPTATNADNLVSVMQTTPGDVSSATNYELLKALGLIQ